jgi:hypothetical protein
MNNETLGMRFEEGQRVAHADGCIGIVENEHGDNDEIATDVRWLTPNNEPSCCVSLCLNTNLTAVPDTVVPMQRNAEWWAEAREFYAVLEAALSDA